ncbi:MAG TPA: diaminopimelate epimerase, partial [Paracoccaceae bacterium]|nr:diaminopimelate epimerase [Paracoccaceae bacterium]
QLVVIRESEDPLAAARLEFWNSDGSSANACGNGTRCAARVLLDEAGTDALAVETGSGRLACAWAGDQVRVNMGPPELDWEKIPLAYPVDTLALPLDDEPSAAGMGNPHCVFVVPDAERVDLARIGPKIEYHPLFPERTNVEFVHVIDHSTIRMRVWERGGRITEACGSGACAAAVTTARRGLTGHHVRVILDGGPLEIDWRAEGVWMTGPTAHVFDGVFSDEFFEGQE